MTLIGWLMELLDHDTEDDAQNTERADLPVRAQDLDDDDDLTAEESDDDDEELDP